MRHNISRRVRAIARAAILACGTAGLARFASAGNTAATWNLDAVGSWTNAADWSSNPSFPNNNGSNTFDAQIDSAGAQVTLNAPISINRLTLTAGTLQGSSSLRALNSASWLGGNISGTGTLNIDGTLLIDGSDHGFSGFAINIGSLATADWTSHDIHSVDVEGGTFNNAGTFNSSTSAAWFWSVVQTPTFNNLASGRFIKTGDADVTQEIQAVFNNAGTLDVQSGDLFLDGGGTSSGTFLVAAGANLLFSDFNEAAPGAGSPITKLQSGSVVKSHGGIWFSRFSSTDPFYDMSSTEISGKYDSSFTVVDCGPDGSVTFKPGARVSTDGSIGLTDWYVYTGKLSFNTGQAPNVGMNNVTLGGELGGSDEIAIWGGLHWSSGTISGSGTANVYTEGAANLDGVDKFIFNRFLVSQGAATTSWTSGDVHLNNSAIFNDIHSTWLASFDGTIVNDAPADYSYFYNYGTFTKSSGVGATSFVNVEFDNVGTVNVQTGRLRLAGGGLHTGTFNISASGILELSDTPGGLGIPQTLQATSVISGPAGSQLQFVDTTGYSYGSISVDALGVENSNLYVYSPNNDNTGVVASALGSYGNLVVQAGGTWNNASFVQIGASGDGGLYINNGVVNANVIDMAVFDPTASGYMAVSGASARVHNSGYLRVSNVGTAQMDIMSGGQVDNTAGIIASEAGSAGTVTVDGAGSKWTNSQYLNVGYRGSGSMSITHGGVVQSSIGYLGGDVTGIGSVLVRDAGSQWNMGSFLSVGTWHDGTLNILSGGVVRNVMASIGDTVGTHGYLHVGGTGSQWNSSDFVAVGSSGNGTLIVDTGAHVSSAALADIGLGTTASGFVTVDGAGSRWDAQQQMLIGIYGPGTLNITNGAVVTSKKSTSATSSGGVIGRFALGAGTVNVTGAGSRWDMAGIGDDGTLNIGFGSVLISDAGPGGRGFLNINNGGVVTSVGGFIGRAAGAQGTVSVGGTGSGSAWSLSGPLCLGGDTTAAAAGAAGTLIINAGGAVASPAFTQVWNNGTILYQGGTFSTGTFTLTGGGKAILSPGNNKVLQTTAISVDSAGGSKLDLSNNKAIIDYPSIAVSPANSIRQQIRPAYNDGAWNGNGITTSMGNTALGLGYADNSILHLSSFGAIAVDNSSVLIKYTYLGDSNLDGQVNINDLYALASNYNTLGKLWTSGDFNYDGKVDVQDLTLLARNWQAGVGSPLDQPLDGLLAGLGLPMVAVPEPGCAALLVIAGISLSRRARHPSRCALKKKRWCRRQGGWTGWLAWCAAGALAALGAAATPHNARAQTITWNNPAGGTFNVPGNWNPVSVPALSTHTAVFSLAGPYTVSFSANAAHGTLLFQSGAATFSGLTLTRSYTLSSLLAINGGTFTLGTNMNLGAPSITVASGATLRMNTGAQISPSGNVLINGLLDQSGNGLALASGGNITVSGAGAVWSRGSGALRQNNTLSVLAGGSFADSGSMNFGDSGGVATLLVDGAGSRFSAGSASLWGDGAGGAATISFTNGAVGSFSGAVTLGANGGSGQASVNSGAALTFSGDVVLGSNGTALVSSGGKFNSNGNISISGLLSLTNGNFNLGSNASVTISGASAQFIRTGTGTFSNGSGLGTTGGIGTTNVMSVLNGGIYSSDSNTNIAGTLLVDGVGSRYQSLGSANWGSAFGATSITFNNGAAGTLGSVVQSTGQAVVQGGSSLVIGGDLSIGTTGSIASFTLSDPTSAVTMTGATALTLGQNTLLGGTLNVLGGTFTAGGGTVNVRGTGNINLANGGRFIAPGVIGLAGVISIDGGQLSAGTINLNAGAAPGSLSFNSGTLQITGSDVALGPAVLFGNPVVLNPARTLIVNNTTSIAPGGSVSLQGGTLSTGALSMAGGVLDFQSGTLRLTGSDFVVGSGGPFGALVDVRPGQRIDTTGGFAIQVQSGAVLQISGGSVFPAGGTQNAGQVVLNSALATIGGGTFSNAGLLSGTGQILAPLANQPTGELRLTSASQIRLGAAGNQNDGLISLLDGIAEFTGTLNNSATGRISGRGTLKTAGLFNAGTISLSAGFTDVSGPLTNAFGAKVIVTGGSTSTFYNPVINNAGSEFRVSTESTAVFLGNVSGAGSFSGQGMKIFEAGGSVGPVDTLGSSIVSPTAAFTAAHLREVSLEVDGITHIAPDGGNAGTSRLNQLNIAGSTGAWTGKLDLNDNDLAIDYSSVSPLMTVKDQLHSGSNGGAWTGNGITTSAGDATHGLGYGDNSSLGFSTFSGQSVDGTSVLIKFTLYGDSNLDSQVDINDLYALASNYNTTGKFWTSGDFNYDGTVDLQDLTLLAHNWQAGVGAPLGPSLDTALTQLGLPGVVVPEPYGLWLCILPIMASPLVRSRRRPPR